MPDYTTLYPGRFLSKEALPGPKVIRIMAVTNTELENEKGKMELKATVKYKAADGEGEIVWCKSNAILTAAALDTRDYAQWVGRLLTIAHDPDVKFGGKKVGGVRVVGSPEMKTPKKVEIKMPYKKLPDVYQLHPTDNKGRPKTVAAVAPEEPPAMDPPDDDFEQNGDAV